MADVSRVSVNGAGYDIRDKVAVLRGTGKPSTTVAGTVGQLYEDTTNGDLYICKAVSGQDYIWEKKSQITMTNVDPGEGADLDEQEYIAVYGQTQNDRAVYWGEAEGGAEEEQPWISGGMIENGAVGADKIDWNTVETIPYTIGDTTHIKNSTDYPLRITRFGHFVCMSGSLALQGYSGASDGLLADVDNAISFSSQFAPKQRYLFFASGTGNRPVRVMITTNGTVGLGRGQYANSAPIVLSNNATINFGCSWIC